jgi:ribose 5-phosphate isomerase A
VSDAARLAAAARAVALVEDGMRLGLGTGRAAGHVIRLLGARVRAEGLRITCVATSRQTEALARAAGLVPEDGAGPIDLAIDGADQIERATLRLIKGGGGALLREKIVAEAAARFVVVAEAGKLVERLDFPLPVEILPFGALLTAARIAALGGAPRWRDGAVTDNGNLLLDCQGFAPIRDPFTLERQLRAIAGVVATGLFTMRVERAILGHDDGRVEERRP